MKNTTTNRRKSNIVYTVLIYINYIAFGITCNALWPVLIDLSYIYDVSNETLDFLATFAAFGYMIGSLTGFIYKWINRQLVLIFMVATMAFLIAYTPYYSSIYQLFVATLIIGIGSGSWESSNTVWLVEMWPKHQASAIQIQQFMYGIGSIISPSMLAPFVQGIANETEVGVESRKSLLIKPFITIGVLQLIVPIIMFIMFFCDQYERTDRSSSIISASLKNTDVENDATTADDADADAGDVKYRYVKLFLVGFMLAAYMGAEMAYNDYSDTMFQYWQPDHLTATESATVMACLSTGCTVGCLITAIISLRIRPNIIIAYHLAMIVVALSLLYAGRQIRIIIYISNLILGYGFSAMWPAIIAFTERRFRLTDRASSLIFFFNELAVMFSPVLIGQYLTTEPLILLLVEAIYMAISIILFIVITMLVVLT
ncbi:hypothetical protein HUG17_8532 [Dermatophagoides farinae]|uniref:Major facilitator superfamily (MFS) profile domain-containing protein n=1 Tax=Dermatophagoides farinae TaxID=6954 RepID=A0A9D4SGR3_DERFA|nr:hypothetical protein HUG17_8532 [Dermatophagoides farinae]